MTTPRTPFIDLPKAQAGHGAIHVANLAHNGTLSKAVAVLQTLEYQYPLKLVAPSPLTIATRSSSTSKERETADDHELSVFTVFMLSYGGGLVAGDAIDLTIRLDPGTRLNLLTQGSTKVFKTRQEGETMKMILMYAGRGLQCHQISSRCIDITASESDGPNVTTKPGTREKTCSVIE